MSDDIKQLRLAVNLLEEAIAISADKIPRGQKIDPIPRVLRAGVIKIFENTFDISCKYITNWLKEKTLINEFRLLTTKDIFHFASNSNLINNPNDWNKFFEIRRISSKSFDHKNAEQIYRVALEFFPSAKTLLSKLDPKN